MVNTEFEKFSYNKPDKVCRICSTMFRKKADLKLNLTEPEIQGYST